MHIRNIGAEEDHSETSIECGKWEKVGKLKYRRSEQRRRTVIYGTGAKDDELKTIERVRKIHACFFAPEITEEAIKSYMNRRKQGDSYHVEKLKLAHTRYASFCISVPSSLFGFFLAAENWPDHTQVSEWFRISGGRARGVSRNPSKPGRTVREFIHAAAPARATTAKFVHPAAAAATRSTGAASAGITGTSYAGAARGSTYSTI